MKQKIETHAVQFGSYGKDYAEIAERYGITETAVFIMSSFQDLMKTGDLDEPVIRTAREQLLAVADDIEENGVTEDRRHAVAELVRYLAQFTLDRPAPSR